MKPFLLGLLKCKRCSFMTKLVLECERAEMNEIDIGETMIFNKHVFLEGSGERLRDLVNCLRDFQVGLISDDEISLFVENPDDDERVKKFLFGIDIVEGVIRCDGCGLQYPIRNSIVETVDVIESK